MSENEISNANGNVYTVSNKSIENDQATESLDNFVSVDTRGTIFKKRNSLKRLSIIFFTLAVILLIAFIVILYCYIKKYNELKRLKRHKICASEECLRSAANLKLAMDTTANPCDDFYAYTCGRWSKENLNHGWYPHFSSFETADERIAISAINFFQSNLSSGEPLPALQSRDLYLSCMNTKKLDSLGLTVLYKYLKQVDLPVIPAFFTDNKSDNYLFDWIKTDVAVKKSFAMDVLIGILVDADIYNRSNRVIYMGTPDAACPLPSPVKAKKPVKARRSLHSNDNSDDEYNNPRVSAYKNVIVKVMKAIFENNSVSLEDATLIEAADLIWNTTVAVEQMKNRNSTATLEFYKIKVNDLQTVTDQFLSQNNATPFILWRPYLEYLFKGLNVQLDLDDKDYLYIPEEELVYLPQIALYLSSVSNVTIELYMWWITVNAMILSTTTDMSELVAKESQTFAQVNVYRPRSLDCAILVINFMGVAVSYGIADRTFLNKTKPKVEQMLDDIKEAFVEKVLEIKWMDAETKKLTLEKSREMISFIGFPDWLLNKEALETYYANLTVHNDTFLANLMRIIEMATISQLSSLREKSERDWKSDPTTVNAYNYFSDNSITVPMAILTYPFYNLGLEALNYGAIGSILGHELTHGFDNSGRKFDKYGNYKEWWTNTTSNIFENKTSCFINQYSNYSIPTIEESIDGEQTLGENLADNGGLNHAYYAYKNYARRHNGEAKLPGFENFSDLQLFFLAYGSVWCEAPNIAALQLQIENDDHCPSSIRVLGTLQNSYEFSAAYNCPLGSKMNPNRTRCRIW